MSNLSGQEVPAEDLPDNSLSGKEVPPEDLPDQASQPQSGQEVPASDLPDEDLQAKYGTPGQQALTMGENFAKGLAPGIATYGEQKLSDLGVPGITNQDILARKQANPIEATGSEIAGNVGLMAALPEAEFAKFGQVGAKAINSMIQMGLITGGDELSKSLLGQGDPGTSVAANIAESGAAGLFGGALFGKAEQVGLKALENAKLGTKLKSFMLGMGHAATIPGTDVVSLADSALMPEERAGLSDLGFKAGQTAYKNILPLAAGAIGKHVSGWSGAGGGYLAEKALEKVIAPYTSQVSQKYIAPALLKAASSGFTDNLASALNHATSCARGNKLILNGIDNIFKSGGTKAIEEINSERDRARLQDYIDNGGTDAEIRKEAQQEGIQPQGFAEGGEVKPIISQPSPIASIWPEQNTMLSAAKGRISNYLNSVRPLPPINQAPYDSDHKDPQKEREYNKVLDLANQPLSILNRIKDGSLVPKDMKHFTNLFPELHDQLSKKITERIMKDKISEEKKPNYHVRQALSLFLGNNLDSSLSQPNMAAAQAVFMQQKSQQQPKSSAKPSLSKVGQSAQTPEQGREARLNKS